MAMDSVSTVLEMYISINLQGTQNDAYGPTHSAHHTLILHMMLT